jgi:WD40 repeat protein
LPLGLVAVQMVAAASGGGPLWDGGMRFLWLGLGAGSTIIIMGLARLPNLGMGVKVGVGVGLDVLAYGVFLIVALVRLGPSSPSLTDPDTWTNFESPEGRFAVALPGQPEAKTVAAPNGVQVKLFAVERKREKELFLVLYYDRPDAQQLPGSDAVLDAEKDDIIDKVKDRKGARSKQITLGGRYPGREGHVDTQGDDVVLFRLYYVKGRLYTLWARAARARLDDGSLAKFLDSFKLAGLGPASPSLANPDTWKPFSPPEGRFTVSFPGEPETKNLTGPNGVPVTLFTVERKPEDEEFAVRYYDLPDAQRPPDPHAPLAKEQNDRTDEVQDRRRVDSKAITLAGKFPGREAHVETQVDAVVVCRVYYVNGRVYSLTARAARARLDDGSLARFLDSFKLVGEPPPAGPEATGPFRGHDGPVRCMDVAPAGNLLATGGQDGNVMLWDVNTGKRIRILADAHPRGVHRVAFAADGRTLASVGEEGLTVWRPAEGKRVFAFRELGEYREYLAVSPDGALVATAARDQVWLFDVAARQKLPRIQTPHPIRALAFHTDGKTVLIGTDRGEIHRVDARKRKGLKPLQSTRGWSNCLAVSAGGKVLAVGAANGLEVFEFPSLQRRPDFDGLGKAGVVSVAFSPDGSRLAFVQHDRATVWDLQGRKKLGDVPEKQRALQVFFHPDGDRVIVRCGDDIRVHEVAKLK